MTENWPQFIIRKTFGMIWDLCPGGNRLSYDVIGSTSLAGSDKGLTALVGNFVFVTLNVGVSL